MTTIVLSGHAINNKFYKQINQEKFSFIYSDVKFRKYSAPQNHQLGSLSEAHSASCEAFFQLSISVSSYSMFITLSY